MEEFIVFCLQVLFWYFVFSIIFGLMRAKRMKHEQRTNEFVQRATSMIHAVVEEQHGDLYYWFDQETGVFLAQGKDLPEVTAQLLARFPNHVFVMPGGDYALAGPKMEAILVKDLTKRLSDV